MKEPLLLLYAFLFNTYLLAQKHGVDLFVKPVDDINGDKKADLLLYRPGEYYIIYGNDMRKFILEELKL